MEVVLELVRSDINEQYPTLMPTPYAGELATAQKPFGSIDDMWLVSTVLSTTKISAMNGARSLSLPPLAVLSLHSHASGRTHGRSAASSYKGVRG